VKCKIEPAEPDASHRRRKSRFDVVASAAHLAGEGGVDGAKDVAMAFAEKTPTPTITVGNTTTTTTTTTKPTISDAVTAAAVANALAIAAANTAAHTSTTTRPLDAFEIAVAAAAKAAAPLDKSIYSIQKKGQCFCLCCSVTVHRNNISGHESGTYCWSKLLSFFEQTRT
jgi:hypothetical protein